MIEIVKIEGSPEEKTIYMREMKPLQIGKTDFGHIVMRTASVDKFEVMDLTEPIQENCWTGNPGVRVRLLNKNESVTLKISNEE